jgi:hypothetical protein
MMSDMIEIRIAVAIDADGDWCACGYSGYTDEYAMGDASEGTNGDPVGRYWITASIPRPSIAGIPGKVEVV